MLNEKKPQVPKRSMTFLVCDIFNICHLRKDARRVVRYQKIPRYQRVVIVWNMVCALGIIRK